MRDALSCKSPKPMLALVAGLSLGLAACEDPKAEEAAPAATREPQDASTASPPRSTAQPVIKPVPQDLGPEDPEQLMRWKQSSMFSFGFSDRGCNNNCPEYFLGINQSGQFKFDGGRHVARPGQYTVDVGAARTKALYQQLLDLGILRLYEPAYSGQYERPEDSREISIMLNNGDESLRILYLGGMIVGSAGDALSAIVDLIATWEPIQHLMSPSYEPCYEVDNRFEKLVIESVKTNYQILSQAGEVIGTLGFVEPPPELLARADGYAVRVSNCQGEEVFVTTQLKVDGCGFAVTPEFRVARALEPQPTTFPFPGIDHEVNAVLLGVEKDSTDADAESGEWALHALDADMDTKLRVRVTDVLSCD